PLSPRAGPEPGTFFALRDSRFLTDGLAEALRPVERFLTDLKAGAALLNLLPEPERPSRLVRPISPEYKRLEDSARFKTLQADFLRALEDFDVRSLRGADPSALQSALDAFSRRTAAVAAFARERTVYAAGNSHIDLAWLWRWRETVEVARATFSTILDNMEEYPEIVYLQSQAQAYKWMEERYPELFERIRRMVKKGRWEIVGGMWVEPDCNLIDGESFVRQLLYGKRYFREKFGVEVTVGWNPDSFGYNANMPQLFRKAGLEAFVTQKISWNDTNVFPHHFFWWESPDGTRLLTYFPPTGYVGELRAEEVLQGVRLFERNTGLRTPLILYGLGDHGGGPNREMLDRARAFGGQKIFPRLEHTTFQGFLGLFPPSVLESLPVWRDELYLEYHRGTFTTQAETKRFNRKSEVLLADTEKLSSLAWLTGGAYRRAEILQAWEKVLMNQFHDILPGSSIHAVYRDAKESYLEAHGLAERALNESLEHLASRIATDRGPEGRPLLVFNTLAWERDGLAAFPLEAGLAPGAKVFDDGGREIPCQIDPSGREASFLARRVPALGYRVFWLRPEPNSPPSLAATGSGALRVEGTTLENEHVLVEIDPESGNIRRIFDKTNRRDVIADGAEANRLQLLEDIPDRWDAWNIQYTGRQWNLDKARRVRIGRRGPVQVSIVVDKEFLGLSKTRREPASDFPSSFFSQEILLTAGVPQVEIRMKADWWEDHVLLKAAFPVAVSSREAFYEIPYAHIARPTSRVTDRERARFEVPALRWADLSDGAYGVSLLNESKYGHDIEGGVMRLTLLRSPLDPDPLADRGRHEFSYALYPHAGTWREADTVRRGHEFNTPLLARLLDRRAGDWPASQSFFGAEPSNVVLSAVKKAEDRDSLVLRLYEAEGTATRARLRFFRPPKEAHLLDLMENRLERLRLDGRAVDLEFGRSEIKSVELVY
ncbi:MAG: alpha-mannosidase, partial [Candidatus Aminicenantes bacterium]|nr:alpha-mannosidase [Candidatus Aminicenantes bacterium]